VRERHVAAGFPIADGLSFLEFASKSSFRPNVEPEGEMRAKGHGVEASHVIAINATNNAASDQSKDKAICEDNRAGTKSGDDAMLELIEEIGSVHKSESETSDRVFSEEFVDVAANKIGTAQSTGLNRETFGFQPFLKESDLRGTPGAVHAFDDNEGAVEFAGIEANEGFAEEGLRIFGFEGCGNGRLRGRSQFDRRNGNDELIFVLVGHVIPTPRREEQSASDRF
jgi:hypothetical protein